MLKTLGILGLLSILALAVMLFASTPFWGHDVTMAFDDDITHFSHSGGMLGWVIAAGVMMFVGMVLAVVFAGVSLVMLVVGAVVGFVLILALIPVMVPVMVILALPFLAVYGLVKAVR